MAFVQAQKKQAVPSSTTVTTPSMTTTVGNVVILQGSCLSSQTMAASDSKGNTWTAHPNNPNTAGGATRVYSFKSTLTSAGAGHTFTLTGSVSDNISCIAAEFSGRNGTVDSTGSGVDGGATTTHSTGSVTVGRQAATSSASRPKTARPHRLSQRPARGLYPRTAPIRTARVTTRGS